MHNIHLICRLCSSPSSSIRLLYGFLCVREVFGYFQQVSANLIVSHFSLLSKYFCCSYHPAILLEGSFLSPPLQFNLQTRSIFYVRHIRPIPLSCGASFWRAIDGPGDDQAGRGCLIFVLIFRLISNTSTLNCYLRS